MRAIHFTLTLALVLTLTPQASADRRLSLPQAMSLAVSENQELRLETAKISEAKARQLSTRGLYGPKLMAEANVLVWDSALTFTLDTSSLSSMDLTKIDLTKLGLTPGEMLSLSEHKDLLGAAPKLLGPLLANFSLGNIRDQVTSTITLTLAQPLTPLLQIHSGYKATSYLTDSAVLDRDVKQTEIVGKVIESYLTLMQVQRLMEVAQTGVDQVQEHVKRAKQFHVAGLIGKQEVLKANVELARAKERAIKARYGASLASSALALQIGLSIEESITTTEKVTDPPPRFSMSLSECLRRAAETRPELRSLDLKRRAAEADVARNKWDLYIPQISAVANYQHTEGQGTFSPKNAFFFGGVLKWDLWDWGGKYYTMQAASAKTQQVEIGKRMLRDGVALQTKKAYLDLQQSDEALTVARIAIDEAEENFRIEQKRFEANANTSTDVLDSQLALTRAKLTYTSALYGYYIARAALYRSMGEAKY
jgi:outer membrane protein